MRPGRNEGGKRIEPCGIGVSVGADVDARGAGLLNLRDDLRHLSPLRFARGLEVPDFDRDVRFAANANGFVNGGGDGRAFTAHVRGIDAAEFGGFAC